MGNFQNDPVHETAEPEMVAVESPERISGIIKAARIWGPAAFTRKRSSENGVQGVYQ
jgi:hypothetical protein